MREKKTTKAIVFCTSVVGFPYHEPGTAASALADASQGRSLGSASVMSMCQSV